MELKPIDVSSTSPRATLARVVLACLLLWPPVQHMLHRTYRISPWKYLGLGVYCRPKLTIQLEVRADGRLQEMRGLGLDGPLSRFLASTRTWGVLANPTEAGCAILDVLHPTSGTVEITRSEHDLSASGWIREERFTWRVSERHCEAR